MRYWWVNQNQTFQQEVGGGYIWSPKRKSNGARNPYYEFMREVAPGDLILSYRDTRICRIGVAQSYAFESPKPPEFGAAGPNWNQIGWRIDVHYIDPGTQVRPANHMDVLGPHLPDRYSPLRPNGGGLQNIYLAPVSDGLMRAIARLVGPVLRDLLDQAVVFAQVTSAVAGFWEWEVHLENQVLGDPIIPSTEREQLIMARRGQGRFRENVGRIEHACRVTGVNRSEHLRASHIKPWRSGSNEERLDGENGLLLTPTIDHLFDRGFISFEDNGRVLLSPVAHQLSLERMGVTKAALMDVKPFTQGQRRYLDYHRESVFLQAHIG
ncbi:MAG: HNH endonuclease [Pseudomonadales bacterium]